MAIDSRRNWIWPRAKNDAKLRKLHEAVKHENTYIDSANIESDNVNIKSVEQGDTTTFKNIPVEHLIASSFSHNLAMDFHNMEFYGHCQKQC